MLRDDNFVVRFAVGCLSGPRSAVFRVWSPSGKSDVYASVRNIAGEIKISLHGTGECNAGLTDQFAKKKEAAIEATGGSRHQSRWNRLKPDGFCVVVPLKLTIPASELRSRQEQPISTTENVTWLEPPKQGRTVIIYFAFTRKSLADSDWPGHLKGTHLLGTKLLPNGEKFWLFWQDCPIGPVEQTILSEAQTHMKQQRMVPFSSTTDYTQPTSRHLIFREFFEDSLLVVLDAATH